MKKVIKIIYLFIFILTVLSIFSVVNAASAELKPKVQTVNVGDKTTVEVIVNAATCNLKVSGSATDTIIDFNMDAKNKITEKEYTIDTSKAGTYTVYLKGDITDGETDLNTKINESVTITVKAKTEEKPSEQEKPTEQPKSTNAYLSTLGVTPKEYDFSGFKKDTMNYSVTVPYNVDSLKVIYKTADSGAKVTVTGNSNFEVGSNNKITLKVTAEDGKTTKTYTIKVTKLAQKEENNDTSLKPENPTEQPKSTNAYLSTLGVTPKEYDFSGFKKTTMNYSVTVPYDVDSLKVLYKTADSNAKVKVTGNSGFEVGSSNKITIKVTAEDGKTTKTYTIKVTKLAEEEEKPGNIIEDNDGIYLTSLELDGVDILPEFAKDTYSYTATLTKDLNEISVNATANKENTSIEISGNTNLVVGENIITIIVKQEDSVAKTVYQVTLNKEASNIVSTDTNNEEPNFVQDIMGSINKYVVIAVGIVLLMVITVIVLIVLLVKENKRLKEEENNEEYDVYENDENEFENNEQEKVKKETEEYVTEETETKNERKRSRREKGKHSR